jgi:hypothetical protein
MSDTSVLESLFQEDLYLLPSRTLIILNKEWHAYSEADQLLLSKILGSVKLTLAGVQILTRTTFTANDVASFAPRQIIAFGAASGSVKRYESTQIEGVNVVLADPLNDLDDMKKKSLWSALKQMFAV